MTEKILASLLLCLALAGCGQSRPGDAARPGTAFTLPTVSGAPVSPAPGRPVLLFFFTEDCPYCRKAAPFVRRTAEKYGARLAVIGVCEEEEAQAAERFAADFSLTFPVAYKGRETAAAYRANGAPYLYLLDAGLKVYDTWGGYSPDYDARIEAGIEKLLAAAPLGPR